MHTALSAGTAEQALADLVEVTDVVRAAVAGHCGRRARALIGQGMAEDAAIEQAADQAIRFTRRPAQLARQARALVDLVDADDGSIYRLLRDLGDHLRLSLADVDRAIVDEHVGEHSSVRTDWIETLLEKAGVPCPAASATARAGSCPRS